MRTKRPCRRAGRTQSRSTSAAIPRDVRMDTSVSSKCTTSSTPVTVRWLRSSSGMLTVHGEGLRVGRLAIDTGELAIDGAFDALDYTEETASGGGFWSRLFGG